MIIINTKYDLKRLDATEWLPSSVKASVEELFNNICEGLNTEGQPDDMFSIGPEGTIAVLEPTERLSVVLEVAPAWGVEYAEPFASESIKAYRLGILHDNDRMTQYIVLSETLNEEDKALLKHLVTESGCDR